MKTKVYQKLKGEIFMNEKEKVNNESRDGAIGVGMIVGLLGLGYCVGKKHGARVATLKTLNQTRQIMIDALTKKED